MADTKVTIYDIASRANVSVSTVSRVLNGTASVAESKRERVLRTIREMDYQPNALARGLTSMRSRTIGLMLPDIMNPYYASFVFEAERAAMMMGYSLLLCNTMDTYLPGSHELELQYMRTLADRRVDGVIYLGGGLDSTDPGATFDRALERLHERMPLVLVANDYRKLETPIVCCDKAQGIRAMVRHLHSSGHRAMGFIAGRADIEQSTACAQAFLEETSALGVAVRPEWIGGTNYTMEAGMIAARRILALGERPTALLAINDMAAIGCMYACREAGLDIPGDISVTGCDNVEQAMFVYPRLTTVNLHIPQIARDAVSSLLLMLGGKRPEGVTCIRPDLVIRESSGPPPAGR